ncbi:glucosylglycerolphosphate phosphatase [Leptolyngbya valderiana BDU 20041]|nr:glucosylglycerol 3-phosphatase [Geitlerinema sp. CS-897]OAB61587.1 glucosylglycerolphosphate phosphatase [Leptolyngbya valderiana BDU 20041]PPT08877.1 putative glucosylglycerolphosphate phosphatase [Geitlerinema sp. FC II]
MLSPHPLLHTTPLSLETDKLARLLVNVENVLVIQDLDGVCMGLVKDPLTRVIDLGYVKATKTFEGHFFVLTNGEHVGQRGVNRIVERAAGSASYARDARLYLPGLAAGGVQWQDRDGQVSHPGVSKAEMAFLQTVPQRIADRLKQFCHDCPEAIESDRVRSSIDAAVLDNIASPTANLNVFYEQLQDRPETYVVLQQAMQQLMEELLEEAANKGLTDSFFVHYAPNLGRDDRGLEIVRFAKAGDSGTTDFQFMIRGAIKEAGVLAILNRYYYRRTGQYPLGKEFSVRNAPKRHEDLLELVKTHFDPHQMPVLVGIGDTVNSTVERDGDRYVVRRGGSDRNFLQLIQDIGQVFHKGNTVVYVDSSGGEVKNRKPLKIEQQDEVSVVLDGPGDTRDREDPLILNIAFAGGHPEYSEFFQTIAHARQEKLRTRLVP